MSQEYYSVEKESNLGALNIGLSVFQAIVVKAVESVDGVQFEGNMTQCLEVGQLEQILIKITK